MDLLKVLSRGTKKTPKSADTLAPPSKPSNPQLYHDATRGVKRKRNEEALNVASKDDEQDIDFFAPPENKKPAAAATATQDIPKSSQGGPSPQLLDQDEIRQVLRSHRLKFTLLSKHENEKSKVKKPKRKAQVQQKGKEKKSLYPQPLVSFNELRSTYNISPRLVENLAKQGFRLPTEPQLATLPLLIDSSLALRQALPEGLEMPTDKPVNLLAVAPTGSGKTLSFLIPIMNAILRRRAGGAQSKGHTLEALVIAPTRELAHQIVTEGQRLSEGMGVKIVGFKKGMRITAEAGTAESAHGDSALDESDNESDSKSEDAANSNESEEEEEEESEADSANRPVTKADILVTTPMLLLNFLKKGTKSKRTLPTVRSIVLDEADVLLDPLFRDQTLGLVSSCIHEDLQFTCWSATMGSNIEAFLLETLSSPNSNSSMAPLVRLVVGLKDTAVPSVNHRLLFTGDNERGKLYTLRQLLHPSSSSSTIPDMRLPFLVFVQTIERATSLHDELKFEFPAEAGGSSRIATLHSSLSEYARSKIIARFRAGEIWVLITTDLLMRGIDLRGVNGVINYDIPLSAAAYVHRVGRTGRAGHEGGVAVTFYTKEDLPYLKNIANVISLSEKQAGKGSEEGIPKWLMDALPKVKKEDRKKLKERGVESRRGTKAQVTTKSAWERKRENNKRGAIAGSKKRKLEEPEAGNDNGQDSEWGGLDD
ncbi:uncharacterized protein JN550_012570 [Neoarthrinium moseri]|uniref:uncharacterized protein n=1 Tax=Neoarthrinium moseri TaxID=1658444 RepID=UPI001FDE9D2A|nr:uncharacterized protein JN550_012570 [Neoarthrinium moseri]KAI1858523.1 hypothetical protein JN550_012570 [Neoarthrinium moseri]